MDVNKKTVPTEAGRQYATAYAAHYSTRDLPLAFQLYRQLIETHPNAKEAGYAEMQIRNMVNATVPKKDLLDFQIERLLHHFEQDKQRSEDEDQ